MIPKFTFYFYPFLHNLQIRGNCRIYDLRKFVSEDLNLTADDLKEVTKGGKVTKHNSRLSYCASYLKKMGLVENFSSGSYRITERGLSVLEKYGEKLNLSHLRELPEYLATQVNLNNTDVVYVKPHMRGGKYIAPYVCSKKYFNDSNSNLEKDMTDSYRDNLKKKQDSSNDE